MSFTLDTNQMAATLSEMIYRRGSGDQPITISDIDGASSNIFSIPTWLTIQHESGGYYYDDQSGFVGQIVEYSGKIYVVFRGTDMSGGLNLPAMLGWEDDAGIDSKDFSEGNFKLGFGTASRSQLDAALALFDLAAANANGMEVVVAGQSLGGGLAGLVAAVRDVKAYTFAPAPFANQLPYEATFSALANAGRDRSLAEQLPSSAIRIDGVTFTKADAFSSGGAALSSYLFIVTSLTSVQVAQIVSDRSSFLSQYNSNISENLSISRIKDEALTSGLIGGILSVGANQFSVSPVAEYDIGEISGITAAMSKHGPSIHNLVALTEGSSQKFSKLLYDDGA